MVKVRHKALREAMAAYKRAKSSGAGGESAGGPDPDARSTLEEMFPGLDLEQAARDQISKPGDAVAVLSIPDLPDDTYEYCASFLREQVNGMVSMGESREAVKVLEDFSVAISGEGSGAMRVTAVREQYGRALLEAAVALCYKGELETCVDLFRRFAELIDGSDDQSLSQGLMQRASRAAGAALNVLDARGEATRAEEIRALIESGLKSG